MVGCLQKSKKPLVYLPKAFVFIVDTIFQLFYKQEKLNDI